MSIRTVVLFLIFVSFYIASSALGRDLGQWEDTDPVIKYWISHLMQPDNPTISCCGEADMYYADEVEVKGDEVYAIITDTRDDAPLRRPHVPVGTKILVPKN